GRDRDGRRHRVEPGDVRPAAAAHAHDLDQGEAGRAHAPRDGARRFPPDGAEPRGDGGPCRDPRCAQRRLRARRSRARYVRRRPAGNLREAGAGRAALEWSSAMMLADQGFIDLGGARLEYRMIGPRPEEAPTIVMLHEGLGCVGLWGDFPDKLAAATGA